MARGGTPIEAPVPEVVPTRVATAALTASAMNMQNVSDSPQAYRKDQTWQQEGWGFYRDNGPLYYAAQVNGSVMSKATLHAVKKVTGAKGTQDASATAVAALEAFFGGPDGQAEMLQRIGPQLTVAGEWYTVGRKVGRDFEWYVLSTTEIQPSRSGDKNKFLWEMREDDGVTWTGLPRNGSIVFRTWTSDPENRMEASSAVRSQLRLLRRIKLLTQQIEAQLQSRLTGNGILLLPSGMTPPTPPPGMALTLPPNATPLDATMMVLSKAMEMNLLNPGSAAAQVPIALQVDGQYIKDIRLLQFWSELDDKVISMLTEAYKELATGMNMPLEMILGQADSSHWNAWAVDESYIKAHVEPGLAMVAAGIVKGYLRTIPGVDPADTVQVDTTQLRVRPDRSAQAMELYDRRLLSGDATLREGGYGTEDKMSGEEIAAVTLQTIAAGQTTPFLVAAANRMLGNDLPEDPTTLGPSQARPGPAQPAPPDGPPIPRDSEADGPNPFAALVAAAEVAVYGALARAGNKLANSYDRRPELREIPAAERYLAAEPTMAWDENRLDILLAGAWDSVAEPLAKHGDGARIIAALDRYTRSLLAERQVHSTAHLDAVLSMDVLGMKGLMIR